jgi:rRNA-processing protein FCF1
MMAAQFNLDLAGQLQEILPQHQYTVPSFIIEELQKIKDRSNGRNKVAASFALKIASHKPLKIKNISLKEDEQVDDALIRISTVLCTNDRDLRRKARKTGITVIYLRQRKYLAVDGYIP